MSKAKRTSIEVQGTAIAIVTHGALDFISLTDIARYRNSQEPFAVINNWMRSRSTIEFLGLWEKLCNPGFKPLEFERFRNEAGSNYFVLSPQRWIESTQAIGITSKSGRYGGTFAHRDIAFEFASWISPEFKLYLIVEFQRLKDEENDRLKLEWNLQRTLAKINYRIHTDAIKETLIPPTITKTQASFVYANEADLLNVALFGQTAKQWRDAHPDAEGNVRDHAPLEYPATGRQIILLTSTKWSRSALALTSWKAHEGLMQMVKDPAAREFYIQETLANGWSRSILEIQIKRQLHLRLGKAQNNFALTMPPAESDLASQLFKDRSHSSYATGFIPVGTGFCTTRFQVSGASRIVQKPVNHRDKPGGEQEFACLRTKGVSRAGDPHRGLPAAPVVGQLNLYLSAVDGLLKHPDDQPAIGLLLCRKKNRLVAEYALRGLDQSIAVAGWQTQLTDSLPEDLRSSLPTIEEIEAELAGDLLDEPDNGNDSVKRSHAKTRRRKGEKE